MHLRHTLIWCSWQHSSNKLRCANVPLATLKQDTYAGTLYLHLLSCWPRSAFQSTCTPAYLDLRTTSKPVKLDETNLEDALDKANLKFEQTTTRQGCYVRIMITNILNTYYTGPTRSQADA